jgi:sugar lactone lactonase YvrE
MKLGRSRIGMSMALLLGIATMGLGVPSGAAPGAPAALQGVGNASCFSPAPHGFSDVPTTSFANTAISWLVQAGITTGTTPTTFTPQGNTTRAEMAVFLWRNADKPTPAGQQNFTDVPTTSFANTAISWLVEAGITTGTTPTTFSPNNRVTRAQMAVFLHRNAGEPAPTGPHSFTDVPTTSFANTAISWLVEAGITTGTSPTTFSPNNRVTRAEMAVFLWRYNCPDPNLGNVTTLAGSTAGFADGPAATAQFNFPNGVAVAPNGTIYVADRHNNRIRAIKPHHRCRHHPRRNRHPGFADGPGNTAKFNFPRSVAVAADGTVYVADGGNHRIRSINPTTGRVYTLAGSGTEGFADGAGAVAKFNYPSGVTVASNGTVYVADASNHRIRAINPTRRWVSTLAGSGSAGFADGTGSNARFEYPSGVTVAPNGTIYVADPGNNRIRAINPTTSRVTTLAGNGTFGFANGPGATSQFSEPSGVAVAPNGTIYVADSSSSRIRAINPSTSRVTTLAGSGTEGFADGPSATARFFVPTGVAVGQNGTVYVADFHNHRIRKIT